MKSHSSESSLSRGDTQSLWLFIIAGLAITVFTLVQGIIRIVELVRNEDVVVPAVFADTPASTPIGPDGSQVEVALDRAILTVDSLPVAAVWSGVLESLTVIIATGVAVTLLALLSRELIHGRIFSRKNTKLVAAASVTALAGFALAPFFGNMVANAAFAQVSDGTFNNVVMSVDLQQLIVAAFIAAFVSSVFAVGDRLQRDSEGVI